MQDVNYVFDVDGTLTPSRLKIDPEFEKFFLEWVQDKNVYLLTGSDHEKTIEQVGRDIWSQVTESHQCGGNVVYRDGKLVQSCDWKPTADLLSTCQELIDKSPYPLRRGDHLEPRVGLLNISVVGRACSQQEREEYYEWDKVVQERNYICNSLQEKFPTIEATAGGQISVDIHEKGKNKSQIKDKLEGKIVFFGDKTMEGGNDYAIARVLSAPHEVHQVDDWQHTHELLKSI